jgi:8-oxo-dGTP pyrophosphatase MutT (NUDIX family)
VTRETAASSPTAAARPPLRDAAVLAPVHRDAAGELRIVLVVRTHGGTHGGQIALPGGKHEPTDPSLEATALREAWEEIGLPPGAADILAELPVLETRTTGYRIAPFLARIMRPLVWTPDPREVAEVLEPRVADLLDPTAHGESLERFANWPEARMIAFTRVGPHRLWGATHRILSPLLPRLAAGEWEI